MPKQSLLLISLIMSVNGYAGSTSYQSIYDVVFAQALKPPAQAQAEVLSYQDGKLPHYPVNSRVFLMGDHLALRDDSIRTLTQKDDVYPYLNKRLHRNGICFSGTWQIDQPSRYTGYFRQGAKALLMGRASVSLSETKRGEPRGFAFAGKIFPTQDPKQLVQTANFFVADVLAGAQRAHYLDAAMTNQPQLGFRWSALPILFNVARAFSGLDNRAGYRPVDQIAALGESGQVRAPQYLMIKPVANQAKSEAVDFRQELKLPQPNIAAWRYEIWVSDQASSPTQRGWQRLGYMTLDQSVVSFGCDRQLHFAHPKVRHDNR